MGTDNAGGAMQNFQSAVADTAGASMNAVGGAMQNFGSAVAGTAGAAGGAVQNFGSAVAGTTGAGFNKIGEAVQGFPSAVAGTAGAVGGAVQNFGSAVSGAAGSVGNTLGGAMQGIQSGGTKAHTETKKKALVPKKKPAEAKKRGVEAESEAVGGPLQGLGSALAGSAGAITNAVGGTIVAIPSAVGGTIGAIPSAVGGTIGAIPSAVGGAFEALPRLPAVFIGETITGMRSAVGGSIQHVHTAASDTFVAVKDARKTLLAGAIAGTVSLVVAIPLDVRKTIVQNSSATSIKALSQVVNSQTNPFAGLQPSFVAQIPAAVVAFAVYEFTRGMIKGAEGNEALRKAKLIFAACTSDVVGALWVTPFERAKQRIQAPAGSKYSSPAKTTSLSFQQRYKGFWGLAMRDVGYRFLFLMALDEARKFAEKKLKRSLTSVESYGVGTSVAVVSALLTNPLDVAKTRIMCEREGIASTYSTFGSAFSGTLEREGLKGLFRGALPRVGYVAVTSVVFMTVFDQVMKRMDAPTTTTAASSTKPWSSKTPAYVNSATISRNRRTTN
ncbi:hypothetical protein NDN08_006478 [Rhodosorus marinus]|uniref:ADP,ATP carrier protein n=1 Tax=Rhodosorus marinus TaxID=101924 RepID=A0AAV8UHR2_9RHOD|nr:hypothetical protein NDN08_006478 [Rhodosorus marinus]